MPIAKTPRFWLTFLYGNVNINPNESSNKLTRLDTYSTLYVATGLIGADATASRANESSTTSLYSTFGEGSQVLDVASQRFNGHNNVLCLFSPENVGAWVVYDATRTFIHAARMTTNRACPKALRTS